jgi:hypothetical protein
MQAGNMKAAGIISAFMVAAAVATPAFAQQAKPAGEENQNGRYAMTPAPNGFLRMDTRTGAVSLCTLRDGNVTCASSADERGALESEIARLAKENSALRERLAEFTQRGPGARLRDALPNEDEMNKALGLAETFMRRMMRIMREETPKGDRL